MATEITCKECKQIITQISKFCPHCGKYINKPEMLSVFNLDNLKRLCTNYIQNIIDGSHHGVERQYIFEEAMITFYGDTVFDWINKNLE